jgi:hypothetical protein
MASMKKHIRAMVSSCAAERRRSTADGMQEVEVSSSSSFSTISGVRSELGLSPLVVFG